MIIITYSESCICSLILSSMQCAWAVLYCHLWPFRLCYIFPHHHIYGTIFGGGDFSEHKICFDFLYKFVWNISCSKHNSAIHYQDMQRSSCR